MRTIVINIFLFLIIPISLISLNAEEIITTDTVYVEESRLHSDLRDVFPSNNIIHPDSTIIRYSRDIADFLNRNTSLSCYRQGYTSVIATPKLKGENVSVMLDGFSLDSPQLGTFDISLLQFPFSSQLEIIMGSLSPFYSSSNFGGGINFRRPDTGELKSDIKIGWGGYERDYIDVLLQSKLGSLFDYNIGMAEHNSKGYREGEYINYNGLSLFIDFGERSPSIWLFKSKLNRENPPPEPYDTPLQKDETEYLNLYLNQPIISNEMSRLNIGLMYQDYEQVFSSSSNNYTTLISRLDIQHNLNENAQIHSEFSYTDFTTNSNETGNNNLFQIDWNNKSQLRLNNDFTAFLSVGFQEREDNDIHLSPYLGFKYDLGLTTLFLETSYAYRNPTINDLYWQTEEINFTGDNQPDLITQGNPELNTERKYDITFSTILADRLTLSYSRAIYWDKIEWWNVDTSLLGGRWQPVNIEGKSVIDAVNIFGEYKYNILQANIFSEYLNVNNENNIIIPYIPTLSIKGNIGLEHSVILEGLIANGGISLLWWDNLLDDTGAEMDNPLVADFVSGVTIAGVSFNFTVENILGENYYLRRGYPIGGRTFLFDIRIKLDG